MSEKKRVVAVCPDCREVYWQEVPSGYNLHARMPGVKDAVIRALLDVSLVNAGTREKYYLMLCADCSIRRAPPALKETLRKWLQHGEKK